MLRRRLRSLRFRTKLLLAMMLVVVAVSWAGLYWTEKSVASDFRAELDREFQSGIAALHQAQQIRRAAIMERCRVLVKRARIHAALEDDALDLLYPSARDELRDILEPPGSEPSAAGYTRGLRARFYRFLDRHGRLIRPPDDAGIGHLAGDEEAQLSLAQPPATEQVGYIQRLAGDARWIEEVVAMPVVSTQTGEIIAALVLGFRPLDLSAGQDQPGLKTGFWVRGEVYLEGISEAGRTRLKKSLSLENEGAGVRVELDGTAYLLFHQKLNPGSLFPTATELCLYPMATLEQKQSRWRWRIVCAGGGILLLGYAASRFIAARFSRPVEQLAHDSEANAALRRAAEAALATTNRELERSMRFSADASHQLKTPVTVLRAGLEELLSQPQLTADQAEELSALVHQTHRLSLVIEDLLLLSRIEAGHLQIQFAPTDLSLLVAAWLDDLSVLPDPLGLTVDTDVPPETWILGERRYVTMILQNLFENARKYNQEHGRIRVVAEHRAAEVILRIGNTGTCVSEPAQEHIFERFHRGAVGENVPGHGLGLNLSRELARLHGGDVRLVRSCDNWTEFEVRFRASSGVPSRARA